MVLVKSIRSSSSSSSSNRSTSKTYHVQFRFPGPAGPVIGEQQVSVKTWDVLVEREPVEVTYLPDSPGHYRLEGRESDWFFAGIFSLLGAAFAVAGGFILVRAAGLRAARYRMQADGATTQAIIADITGSNLRINREPQIMIRYRYSDDKGKAHRGKEILTPREGAKWKIGDPVMIRYDRKNPRRSMWIGKS